MGVKHLAFMVMALAGLVVSATRADALELGELQAAPGHYPPYVFRLTIISSQHGLSDIPAVTVRRPRDVLSMVKNNVLELRLPALADVELEIQQAGQTLNRLLLKSEFLAARAGLETAATTGRRQPATGKERQGLVVEAKPLTLAAEAPPTQVLLEHEMQEIRQAIETVVGHVTPWEGLSTPARPDEEHAIAPVFTLTFGGAVSIAFVLLFIGYIIRCQTIDRRQRHQLEASIRRLRGWLMAGELAQQSSQRAQLSEHQPKELGLVTIKRRVRVSRKTRRRIRVRTSRHRYEAIQAGTLGHPQISAQFSQSKRLAPAKVVEALVHLRCDLINLQRRLPHMSSSEGSHADSTRATR